MKKQLIYSSVLCGLLCLVFSFKSIPQEPKGILSGTTTVLKGDSENLFMVGKTTDFIVSNQEGGAEVNLTFIFREETMETTLKPGNKIRLLATEGFISAVIVGQGEKAVLQWSIHDR